MRLFKPLNSRNLDVFRQHANKWWTGKEFSLLRAMNELRVPFVVNGLGKQRDISQMRLLDVGCGGGILSEPLARLGAHVTGIDPVFESINQAQLHAQGDPNLANRLKYLNCNIEDMSAQEEHIEAFDGLIASEVVEHIEDVESFLVNCTKVIRPNGSLFITTINQTPLSWLGVILFGEYILKQLPKGTHQYDMFVNLKGLKVMLTRLGYHIKLVNGFMYEPLGGNFYWTPTTLTHYALHAVKTTSSARGINYQQKRHAPKGKKSAARPKVTLDDEEMAAVIPVDTYRERTQKIVNEFTELVQLKLSPRASLPAIESLKIQLEGLSEPLELRDIAQISMKNNNLIVVNLSTMPEALKPAVVAISEVSNLTPQIEVNNIFVSVPRITREHREGLAQSARQAATQAKDKLRSVFSEYSSTAKSRKVGVSEDLVRDVVANLQHDIAKRIDEIDSILKQKIDKLLQQKE